MRAGPDLSFSAAQPRSRLTVFSGSCASACGSMAMAGYLAAKRSTWPSVAAEQDPERTMPGPPTFASACAPSRLGMSLAMR